MLYEEGLFDLLQKLTQNTVLKTNIRAGVGASEDRAQRSLLSQRFKACAHPARIARKFHGSRRELTASIAFPPA